MLEIDKKLGGTTPFDIIIDKPINYMMNLRIITEFELTYQNIRNNRRLLKIQVNGCGRIKGGNNHFFSISISPSLNLIVKVLRFFNSFLFLTNFLLFNIRE